MGHMCGFFEGLHEELFLEQLPDMGFNLSELLPPGLSVAIEYDLPPRGWHFCGSTTKMAQEQPISVASPQKRRHRPTVVYLSHQM